MSLSSIGTLVANTTTPARSATTADTEAVEEHGAEQHSQEARVDRVASHGIRPVRAQLVALLEHIRVTSTTSSRAPAGPRS